MRSLPVSGEEYPIFREEYPMADEKCLRKR
jgi:hypothetical protein